MPRCRIVEIALSLGTGYIGGRMNDPGDDCSEVCDTDLLKQVLEGNKQAREDLAVRTARIIHGVAYHKAREVGLRDFSRQDAEDLVHDILVSLFRENAKRLRAFRGDSSYARWIWVITVNALIDRKRSKANKLAERSTSMQQRVSADSESPTVEELQQDLGSDPREILLYKSLVSAVREACEQVLGEEEKLILDLWCSRKHTEKEMGVMLGKNPNTIATIIHRAQAKILNYVKEKEEDSVK